MFNAFELLDLPVSFDVDRADLEERYEQAQKRFHPDKWGAPTSLIKRSSQGLAARLTQAYQTLKDPVQRGEHLLILKGYWPLPSFPDLMEQILTEQEIVECQKQKNPQDWENAYIQACEDLKQAFDSDVKDEVQRAYWWVLHISKRNIHKVC